MKEVLDYGRIGISSFTLASTSICFLNFLNFLLLYNAPRIETSYENNIEFYLEQDSL